MRKGEEQAQIDQMRQARDARSVTLAAQPRVLATTSLAELLQLIPDAAIVADGDGRIVALNDTTDELFGYGHGELLGKQIAMLIPERFLHAHESHVAAYSMSPGARPMGKSSDALSARRKDGSELSVSISLSPVETDHGRCVVAAVRDISETMRALRALQEVEERYRDYYEHAPNASFSVDVQTSVIVECNETVAEMLGYSKEQLVGRRAFDFYTNESLDHARSALNDLRMRGETRDVELQVRRADGSLINVSLDATAIRDENGQVVRSRTIWRDITERKQAEEALVFRAEELQRLNAQVVEAHSQLSQSKAEVQEKSALLEVALGQEHERARRDSLTGVLNHAAISQALQEQCAGDPKTPVAVVMIDIDGMKATNDTYGHQAGDQALVTLATTLASDSAIIGRYGGDEFIAILPGRDRAAAQRYADTVVASLAAVHLTDEETGAAVPVAASLGIAIYPEEASAAHDLIKLADHAMYASRRARPGVSRGQRRDDGALSGTRAAALVGELVPLLTSPEELNEKLQLVAHRLSVGAGYDAVNFALFGQEAGAPIAQNTFARALGELVNGWRRDQADGSAELHPARIALERTKRPIIIDDPWHDDLLWDSQRAILRQADLRSVLVAPLLWEHRVIGSLGVASRREHAFGPPDSQFLMAVATQVTAIVHMATLVSDMRDSSARLVEAQTETVLMLAGAAEAHDHTTGVHLHNVRAVVHKLARELGFAEAEAAAIGLAAVLHDIGKMRVPDAILANTGRLAPEEWELMKHHTEWGADFLSERPGFELAAAIARCHHERWDGSGYPDGLRGEEIPEAATIVAVADAFDAITSARPYKAGQPVNLAMAKIVAGSGTQFRPTVVAALVRLHKRGELGEAHSTAAPARAA